MTAGLKDADGREKGRGLLLSRRTLGQAMAGGCLSLLASHPSALWADAAGGAGSRLIQGKLVSWRSHPRLKGLEAAFRFLERRDLPQLSLGRHVINDSTYAMIDKSASLPPEGVQFEAHRKYIDVHYMISGQVTTGYAPIEQLKLHTPYDAKDDAAIYDVPAEYTKVRLYSGMFAVFFPGGGHMPNCHLDGKHDLHKVVVKVAHGR